MFDDVLQTLKDFGSDTYDTMLVKIFLQKAMDEKVERIKKTAGLFVELSNTKSIETVSFVKA